MKKTTLLFAVLIAATFISCKKDRTCSCTKTVITTTVTSIPGFPSTTKTTTTVISGDIIYTKARKADAKSACISSKSTDEGNPTAYSHYTSDITNTCDLK